MMKSKSFNNQVTLRSYTRDATDLSMHLQDLICEYARVSNPGTPVRSNERLIDYLTKHDHWSPFEMVHVVLDIKTTRDISRQILRHRSFSFQEFSQRYAEAMPPPRLRECRLQDFQNRQSSLVCDNQSIVDEWEYAQETVYRVAYEEYQRMIDLGVAKEVARTLLPEGSRTRMYMAGNIRSWIHYINLRTQKETQKEHREVARQCAEAIEEIFPMIKEFVHDDG